LHDSALASAVNADQKHVTALLTQHATRTWLFGYKIKIK
jgi:hypothetical protein